MDRAVGLVGYQDDRTAELLGALIFAPRGGLFDAELSICLEPGARILPGHIRTVLGWAFSREGAGFARLTCEIAADNGRAQHFVERVGFLREGYCKRRHDGVRDAIIYGLTACASRWHS